MQIHESPYKAIHRRCANLPYGFWQSTTIRELTAHSPEAAMLYVLAISWCSDHTTDGVVSERTLCHVISVDYPEDAAIDVKILHDFGLLEETGDDGMWKLRWRK